MNGYEFYPEDGSTLYEAGARELSEQARSLCLRLNFAGEYSEGIHPVQIQGRKYLPMFAAGRQHSLRGATGGEKHGGTFRFYRLSLLEPVGMTLFLTSLSSVPSHSTLHGK